MKPRPKPQLALDPGALQGVAIGVVCSIPLWALIIWAFNR